ncbi:metal dependent phosphohydrolase [Spirochaeta thermophila DSM 6578]|uniref:Metal dependent phosphohydrolase n=1 Tax=Winmispira thermophila (strain ATCC 700085 / DSM 6578 / Z-1203) TaxID=869211 RepID=G0GDL1_WINT7|nr:HD domain-containing phosphohydrolase [Spirochaeta thermophila]AEJ61358.1 metal dependent phosphohydrolase [Spirochaeta thermophila DSM 6578]
MKVIAINELKPGIRFTSPVYLDKEKKSLFLPADVPLKGKDLQKLIKWNIEEVYSEGEAIDPDNTRDLMLFLSSFHTPHQKELYERLKGVIGETKEVFDRIAEMSSVQRDHIDRIVDGLVSIVERFGQEVLHFVLYSGVDVYDLPANGVCITLLSLLLAETLQVPRHRRLSLGTGALLHDVGMLRIPEHILHKDSSLTETELHLMRTHPVHAYRIIHNELGYPEEVALVALQHHERWDGRGYPKSLVGDEISPFARIVSVADAFQAMVSDRPYRSPLTGYTAMRSILSENGKRFDPEILKAFIRTVGIYPLGSLVVLNNGAVGVVVETNPRAPLRPRLRLLVSAEGRELGGRDEAACDLEKNRSLFIVKAVEPQEIKSRLVSR